MNLKRLNAILGLLLIALLLFHVGYEFWSYLTFYYNPRVTSIIAFGFACIVGLHVILSLLSVFVFHDGKGSVSYPQKNRGTLLQRISACGMLLFFPLHVFTGGLIAQHRVGSAGLFLLLIAQLLFWACLFAHISCSLTRALVTLGCLSDMDQKKRIDRCVFIICALLFLAAAVIVIRTQLFLFAMGGGQ